MTMTITNSVLRQRMQKLGILDDDAPSTSPTPVSVVAGLTASASTTIHAVYYDRLKRYVKTGWPVLLEGPAASGKTTAVRQLAEEFGMKLFVQQAYRTLGVEDIRGTRGLDAQGTTFEWGLLTRSLMHKHGWYFIDEVNMADPAILSLLNNLLDGSKELTIPETGKKIRVRKDWRFFGAYNSGYTGTGQLNEALVSRCAVIECDHFSPEIEEQLIKQKYPSIGSRAEQIVEVSRVVRAAREAGAHEFDMCLRTAFQFTEEWLFCGDLLEAFKFTVLPKIGDRYTFAPVREGLLEAVTMVVAKSR